MSLYSAERKYRHIVELGLASIFHASIPMEYWDLVFESVVFTLSIQQHLTV
jgi:hypothetical protein